MITFRLKIAELIQKILLKKYAKPRDAYRCWKIYTYTNHTRRFFPDRLRLARPEKLGDCELLLRLCGHHLKSRH